MGLAACDDDKVALAQVEVSPLFKREGRRTPTEIMEQRVGARRQFQIPRMAQLEVEEQGPAEADAVEHLGEDIHAAIVVRWTVGHNTWTIQPYRLSYPPLTS